MKEEYVTQEYGVDISILSNMKLDDIGALRYNGKVTSYN